MTWVFFCKISQIFEINLDMHADLYAPQGVDQGEGGSLSYWCDTEQWLALAAVIVKRT